MIVNDDDDSDEFSDDDTSVSMHIWWPPLIPGPIDWIYFGYSVTSLMDWKSKKTNINGKRRKRRDGVWWWWGDGKEDDGSGEEGKEGLFFSKKECILNEIWIQQTSCGQRKDPIFPRIVWSYHWSPAGHGIQWSWDPLIEWRRNGAVHWILHNACFGGETSNISASLPFLYTAYQVRSSPSPIS